MQETPYRIQVQVKTDYLDHQSDPNADRYVFAYTITIANTGREPARLLDRHWIITDANGKVEEVKGEGVVGKQPYLRPGEAFRYTSGAVLETPVGSMHGSYGMLSDDGTQFDTKISPFSLAVPNRLH
jgi:ApaG protein